ncbi:MAG: outer membrane lipoprotein carrier protein LolA [Verrucomicrobia bacterium]|nr:outer membrane lipoprotein carrier protein LolA [Verrucomicrobiota bacterium]
MKIQLIIVCLLASVLTVWAGGAPAPLTDLDPVFDHPVSLDDDFRRHPFVTHTTNAPVMRAAFTQEKTIVALSRPLTSHGHFVFSKTHGACWKTERPFVSTVLMTPNRFTQINPDGTIETIPSSRHAMMQAMTAVFTAMLTMDPILLAQHFDVFAQQTEGGWTIGLVPRQTDMRKLIRGITLAGEDTVLSQLTLYEQYGDRTRFTFHADADRNSPLTPAETAIFESTP